MKTTDLKIPATEEPSSCRMLIVEDNIDLARTMVWTMELLGHHARMAHDSHTAIELARSFHPDIILLDIGIPDINGYEICRVMRKEPSLKDTIFIAHTGWSEKEHHQRSKEAGFDYHLVKPADIEEIKEIISSRNKNKASV